MAVQLAVSKSVGQGIQLSQNKVAKFRIALSWKGGHDLDASLIALDRKHLDDDYQRVLSTLNEQLVLQSDVNRNHISGGKKPFQNKQGYLLHTGDVQDGDINVDDVDDEVVIFDLANAPSNIDEVIIVLNTFPPNQVQFKEVKDAKVDIYSDDQLILSGSLTSDFDQYDTVIFGSIQKTANGWEYNPQGTGSQGGIQTILNQY